MLIESECWPRGLGGAGQRDAGARGEGRGEGGGGRRNVGILVRVTRRASRVTRQEARVTRH
eukprot:3638127-Rhodomonas_salina.2